MAGTEPTYRTVWQATSATIKATPGNVIGMLVYANGAANATATLRDGGSGGDIKLVISVATQHDCFHLKLDEATKIRCATDIYVGMNNTDCCIWYE
jgi:hypothetical protein